MTETKTKFEIEPAPAAFAFDFNYIASHWLVLISMPLGMIPLGEGIAINPQAVWLLELVELMEERADPDTGQVLAWPTGESGIQLQSVSGGEVELDSAQCVILEKIIRKIEGELQKAGHPTSGDNVIDLVGKAPTNSKIINPWKK